MKKYCLLISFLAATTAFAQAPQLVKTCAYTIKIPGESKVVPTVYQIYKNENTFTASTSQTVDGQSVKLPVETVTISEFDVRPKLSSASSDAADLNEAEQLIAGTMEYLEDPDFGSSFNVGLDLSAIRHAKLYQVGKSTHMGRSVIVDAQDKNGKALGSFVTGFMPFACAR